MLTEEKKAAAATARKSVTTCYCYAEHGCAVAYAACEFLNAHLLILGFALVLLGAALVIAGLKIAEAV